MFLSQKKPNNSFIDQCKESIHKGLQMRDGKIAKGLFFLGKIYQSQGDLEKAKTLYKNALTVDAKLIEASRELRLMAKRTEKSKQGFFKKKK